MCDFDKLTDRRSTYAMKWEVEEGALPMWVADMDFETAPAIREAIAARAAHGIFGYTQVPEEWGESIAHWWQERHSFSLDTDWLIFCTGVVPAISSIVRKLTTPGEQILLQTPVYNIFFNSILNNGRKPLECPLVYDGTSYSIDFGQLEEKLAQPQTTLMILCNPHNPVGMLWEKETLARIGELCHRHHVLVLSDEIHCDLTDPGLHYTPFASVSELCRDNSITCIAPTKAFNLAGLQTAGVMVPNPVLRHKVNRALNTDEVAEPNAFAMPAAIAAFTQGGPWLDALREYLYQNKLLVREFLERELPQIRAVPSQATYLLWLDCSGLPGDALALSQHIQAETGLILSSGEIFGTGGASFLRMNVACPAQRVQDGLTRLKQGVLSYEDAQRNGLS